MRLLLEEGSGSPSHFGGPYPLDGKRLQCAGDIIVGEAGAASGTLPAIFLIQPGTVNCLLFIHLSSPILSLAALSWHLTDQQPKPFNQHTFCASILPMSHAYDGTYGDTVHDAPGTEPTSQYDLSFPVKPSNCRSIHCESGRILYGAQAHLTCSTS